MRIRSFVPILLCALNLQAGVTATAENALFLDWPKSDDYEEQFLVETLQGLANRDEARLFVRMFYPGDPTSDDFWKRYLESNKGYKFTRLDSLNEAVRHFRDDGTIKGLVVYPSGSEDMACIAVNVAAQRHLLPVSDRILSCRTQWLSDENHWVEDSFDKNNWSASFSGPLQLEKDGLTIPCGDDDYKGRLFGGAAERWVELGTEVQSAEIEVSMSVAKWGLEAVDMTGTPIWLVKPTNNTGLTRAIIPRSLQGAIKLRLRVVGNKGESATFRRLRFLDGQGQTAKLLPESPKNIFANLPVVEDLRNRFKSSNEAWLWATESLLPKASREMAFSYENIWQYCGMDIAVAKQAFVFRDHFEKNFNEPLPVFDQVMSHVAKPGAVFGWAEPEWMYCSRVNKAGNYLVCSIAPNFSFFQHVPVGKPVSLPSPPSTNTPLKKKYYVIFHVIDGDGLTNTIARYHSQTRLGWDSPRRGQTPICWTVQPLLLKYAPALLEYYAKTATPKDGFMAGPTGAGYTYPSLMPNFPEFGLQTQKWLVKANLHSLDAWDLYYYNPELMDRYLSGPVNKLFCYFPAPPSYTHWAPRNEWLDNGAVILTASTLPGMNLWGNYPENLDWKNDPATDLANRIKKVSETVESPFFIIAHGKMFPDLVEKVAAMLPPDRFEILTMTDTERLATDAGRFTVKTDGSGAAPGQEVVVEVAVRNPDGKSGGSGEVSFELPKGWTATPKVLNYQKVATGTTARQSIRVKIPSDAKPGSQKIVLHKAGDACPRTLQISVYAESRTLFDVHQKQEWKCIGQGAIDLRKERAIVTGQNPADAVTLEAEIDFDRSPILEVFIPATKSKWGIALQNESLDKKLMWGEALSGTLSYDLAELIDSRGHQQVRILLAPSITGQEMELGWIRLHYRK